MVLSASIMPHHAVADALSLTAMNGLSSRCASSAASTTLVAVAQAESGLDPNAINDNTTGVAAAVATQDEAISIASRLVDGGHSVDLGLMQINSANLPSLGLTVADAFDPCRSIAAGARILSADYAGGETHEQQQLALRQALSRYNTGNPVSGFTNGYVRKVEFAARTIPPLDVGTTAPTAPVADAKAAAPPAPADPNAPPSWDVWSSADYQATHQGQTAVVLAGNGAKSPMSVSPVQP